MTIPKFSDFLDEELLRESINDKYLFKAVFLAGGPGSGKSFIATMSFKGLGVFVNSDLAFEHLLKKGKLPFVIDDKNKIIYAKQMEQRGKAKRVISNRFLQWVNGMLPLIIDGTGRDYDKIKKQKEALENIGYDTYMVFVNTNLDVAKERNEKRERKVPEDFVVKGWKQVQNNIGKFQSLFGSGKMLIVDNNEILEGKALKDLELKLSKNALKVLNSSLENRIGKNTIEVLKDTKGKYIADVTPDILTQKGFKL